MKMKLTILVLLLFLPFSVLANTYTSSFDSASSQYFSDTSVSGFTSNGDHTYQFWIRVDTLPSTAGSEYDIFYNRNASGGDLVAFDTSDNLLLSFWDTGLQSKFTCTGLAGGDVNSWVHFSASFDVSVPKVYVYKDGTEVGCTTNKSFATQTYHNNQSMYVGANSVPSNYFDGYLDDFRVWLNIIGTTTLAENYDCTLDGDETDLIGMWLFENNAQDSTANANHFTNNNSVSYQSGTVPYTGGCYDAAATIPDPHDFTYSKDLSIIAGHKHYYYTATATEPYAFSTYKMHIPFLTWFIIFVVISFIGYRILIEFIIRWRL